MASQSVSELTIQHLLKERGGLRDEASKLHLRFAEQRQRAEIAERSYAELQRENSRLAAFAASRRIRADFIAHMDSELAANEPRKGDFATFRLQGPEDAIRWLEEHTAKLKHALTTGEPIRVREYCADVANISMKIEECFGPSDSSD